MQRSFISIMLVSALVFSCMSPAEPFNQKRVIVPSKQTVEIGEINLSITNNGCGRKWMSNGDEPAFEKAFCDLVIKRSDVTIHAGSDSKPVYIGDLKIEIEKMNPWGRAEDSVPPGGCRILVTKTGSR